MAGTLDCEAYMTELDPKALEKAREVYDYNRNVRPSCDPLASAIMTYEAELAKEGWRSIESAPHNKAVLLSWNDWRDGRWIMEVGAASTGQRYKNGHSSVSSHGSATHWRPLPIPPATQETKTDE
jgi:hypothetical protein